MNRRKFFATSLLGTIAAALGLKATTLGDKVAYLNLSDKDVLSGETVYFWNSAAAVDLPGYRFVYKFRSAYRPTEEEITGVLKNLRLLRHTLISRNFQNPQLKAVSDAYCQSSFDHFQDTFIPPLTRSIG